MYHFDIYGGFFISSSSIFTGAKRENGDQSDQSCFNTTHTFTYRLVIIKGMFNMFFILFFKIFFDTWNWKRYMNSEYWIILSDSIFPSVILFTEKDVWILNIWLS